MNTDYLWKALISEFLGTFTLVFVGAGAVALTAQQGGSLIGSAFAFGLALMVLIYTWGSYSGSHLNPAVSFGFAVAGRMNWGLMIGYWIAQLLGGIAAAALIAYIFGTASGAGASIGSLTNTDAWKAVLLEAILTFFLVITFLLVTRNPMLAIASGLAIGLVLTFNMLVGAPLTGASMNPARSLGPALFSNNIGTYWIYVVGPLIGAFVAALIYKLFTNDWSCCTKRDECGKPIVDECGNPLKECKRPVVDNCGKPVKDCNGNVYETYLKHERKLTHMQETPLLAISEWMYSHGFDPRYLKQEFDHAVNKVTPGGVVPNPQAVVQNVIQGTTPVAAGAAQVLNTPGAIQSVPGGLQVASGSPVSPTSLSPLQSAGASSLSPLQPNTNTLMGPSQGFFQSPAQLGSSIPQTFANGVQSASQSAFVPQNFVNGVQSTGQSLASAFSPSPIPNLPSP